MEAFLAVFWPTMLVLLAICLATWQWWHWGDPLLDENGPFPGTYPAALLCAIFAIWQAMPDVTRIYDYLESVLPTNVGTALVVMVFFAAAYVALTLIAIPACVVKVMKKNAPVQQFSSTEK